MLLPVSKMLTLLSRDTPCKQNTFTLSITTNTPSYSKLNLHILFNLLKMFETSD